MTPPTQLRFLPGMDANLLVALDALLSEAHVTRAARRVGLSQSAMSHALGRLRDLFGDPLLVRTARGMKLTERARSLAAPLAHALRELDGVLGKPMPFDPAGVEREFRVAAIDFAQLVLIPPLLSQLRRSAPGYRLSVLPMSESFERGIRNDAYDLAIGLHVPALELTQEDLLSERFVCVVRRGRRIGRLTVDKLAELPHVLVSPRGRIPGMLDAPLNERGLSRTVVLTVPHALAGALAVVDSDAVMTISERVAKVALRGLPVRVLDPPLPLRRFRVSMAWHPRFDSEPAHAFLRDMLKAVAQAV
jgi:DNA-binding transcriptional LysR family regulator